MLDLWFLADWSLFLLQGFIVTLEMTAIGLAGGFVIGSLLAIGDVYGGKLTKLLVNIYVEFFRGSPLIIQLLMFYYGVPSLTGFRWDAFTAGAITLMLNSGAYQKGYLKGAIEAVPKDQLLAAKSLGLSFRQTLLHIVLPQAYRIVIPAWTNEFVSLGKSTSALLIIGVRELTSTAKTISALTFRPFEVYLATAAIYFIWIYLSLKATEIIYEKVKIPGLGEETL
ncbi:MAG: amino acid ABC transporter permease [Pyrodictiaceae archaeon]